MIDGKRRVAEAMRSASNADGAPFGMLSRGVCGTTGTALVCNLPGSSSGPSSASKRCCAIPHALDLLGPAP